MLFLIGIAIGVLIITINVQNLVTHSEDISTDTITNQPKSEYQAISGTWMENFLSVNVLGFDLRSQRNTATKRQIATTSSVAMSLSSSHKADGVVLYRNLNSSDCDRVDIDMSDIHYEIKDAKSGDV